MSNLNGVSIYSHLSVDEIVNAIKSQFPDKDIQVTAAFQAESKTDDQVITVIPIPSAAEEKPDLERLKSIVESKDKELNHCAEKEQHAVYTIQSLQKQQQALYDEFVLLRERYDEQKASLLNILWSYCSRYHPDLRQIPPVEDSETFIENDTQIGSDINVGEELGEGQFASVKICTYKGCEHALKIIKKDRITTFKTLLRVANEIENLQLINSPNVVAIKHVIHTQSRLYIITEKGGADLFEFFDEHPSGVPETWANQIMINILKGVLFCHEQGICHRDLKPENILISFDPERKICTDLKLCDFGLSTKFKPKEQLSDFCGSPGFFAPEMITKGAYYGDKVDVWSMGCILLELLLGHEKFCDAWMTSYDYEVLLNKAKFTQAIHETLTDLPNVLNFSTNLKDFALQFLQVNSSMRPSLYGIGGHQWLDGALDEELANRRASKLSLNIAAGVDSTTGANTDPSAGPPKLVNASALETPVKGGLLNFGEAAGSFYTPNGLTPNNNVSNVDTDLLKAAFNNMSDKERKHLEEYIRHHAGDNDVHAHQLHLPPIEPATPSIGNVKKMLQKGEFDNGANGTVYVSRSYNSALTPSMAAGHGNQGPNRPSHSSSVHSSPLPSSKTLFSSPVGMDSVNTVSPKSVNMKTRYAFCM